MTMQEWQTGREIVSLRMERVDWNVHLWGVESGTGKVSLRMEKVDWNVKTDRDISVNQVSFRVERLDWNKAVVVFSNVTFPVSL